MPTSSLPPTSKTATTAAPVSAAGSLAPYFAAAADLDTRLRGAARLVNSEIGTERQFSDATRSAVTAASPDKLRSLLPPGMASDVLAAVLRVHNDLVSRYWAFRGVLMPTGDADEGYLLRCLGHGATPAARFAPDLATAVRIAASAPAFPVVAPDSEAAAELAVYLGMITGTNSGCMSCGGAEFGPLPLIVWRHRSGISGGPVDGTLGAGGVAFSATYETARGWVVAFQAC